MKYLIIGAAGFVGTNLTKKLLEMGEDVIAVDSLARQGSERNLEHLRSIFPEIRREMMGENNIDICRCSRQHQLQGRRPGHD